MKTAYYRCSRIFRDVMWCTQGQYYRWPAKAV